MTETGPEGATVDQRLLGLSPAQVADLARRMYGTHGGGPLDGPYVPTGSAPVRTASGRTPEQAETEGPLPVAPVPADEDLDSRPAQPASAPTPRPPGTSWAKVRMDPVLLLRLAEDLQRQQIAAQGPPPGYRPPQDREDPPPAADPVTSVRRLLAMGPEVVKAAIPRTDDQRVMRARSIVLRALDDARLWFEEAHQLQQEHEQRYGPTSPPPKE